MRSRGSMADADEAVQDLFVHPENSPLYGTSASGYGRAGIPVAHWEIRIVNTNSYSGKLVKISKSSSLPDAFVRSQDLSN